MNPATVNPLKPWQRIPDWWICVECWKPATGFHFSEGLVAFTCGEHDDHVGYMLMDKLGYGAIGGRRARHPWSYWATSTLFVLRSRIWPPTRRRVREAMAEEARVMAILGPFPPTPFARDSA